MHISHILQSLLPGNIKYFVFLVYRLLTHIMWDRNTRLLILLEEKIVFQTLEA